jgi:uncharacterized protein YbbK (DUF523 family)
MEPFVTYIKVCPEVEIGLVYAETIRIVRKMGLSGSFSSYG